MTTPITIVRTLPAEPAAVFRAWTSGDTLVEPVTAVAMDPVAGGAILLTTAPSDGDEAGRLDGRFLVVEADRRLRYTWRWRGAVEETLIDVAFHPAGEATVVEVTHAGFLDDRSRQIHLDGWVAYLDALPAFL